jgi:hypothetical protein
MKKGKALILSRLYSKIKFKTVEVGEEISGSSPPSVFIGRFGYPKVFSGPLIPPFHGDTSIMDLPEKWFKTGKKVEDIIDFRFTLVRGKNRINVKDLQSRMVQVLQEIVLSKKSVEMEVKFNKKPRGSFLNEEIQPFGPSAPLKEMKLIENVKWDKNLEKIYYDTDLKAKEGMIKLYKKGLFISTIQKALSVGALGLERNRKLVPTRWSITAVDDTISLDLLEKIKTYPKIDEYRVYESERINNKFVILLIPTHWQYETMEAWFPGIVDNNKLEIYSDYEDYNGRKDYASIGGCYYSCRLAISEKLNGEKKQAGAIVFRECYPGYIPLGVWNVRENVREAMKKEPMKFESLENALNYISTRLKIPLKIWLSKSQIYKKIKFQKRLLNFL